MFIPQFILSVCFLVLGFVMVKWPPRKINPLYGYRTMSSMKNQESWDYAQRICSRRFILIGAVMLFVALIEWILNLAPVWCAFILVASPLIAFPYLISVVEKHLKRRFPSIKESSNDRLSK